MRIWRMRRSGLLVFIQADSWVGLDKVEVNFVAEEFADVVHAVSKSVRSCTCQLRCTHLIIVGLSRLRPQP